MEAKRIPRRIKKWQKEYMRKPWGQIPCKISWVAIWVVRKPKRGAMQIAKISRRWYRRVRNRDIFTKPY